MATYPVPKVKLLACLLLVGIALPACGGGDDDGGTPPPSTAIAKPASGSGDAQSGTVAQPLPVPIRVVVTQDGQPLAGATVTWSTTAAGASLSAPSTPTDNSGNATNTWTLGTAAGPQTAQAALSGASGSPVTFTATAVADVAASLSKFSGDVQEGPINTALPSPLVAKVSDQYGNGVAGVAVGWAATGATVSAPTVPTDASGNSSVQVTLGGAAGTVSITATAEGLAGSPQTFTATALEPGSGPTIVGVVNNEFQPPAVTVSTGTIVEWRWQAGATDHNIVPVASEPPSSGSPSDAPDTHTHQFNTPGTYDYYCAVHGGPTFGMRGTITVE